MDEIAKVDKNVLVYKLDISHSFRNFRIDPRDYGVMGLQWGHSYYVEVSMAFGYKHGSVQKLRLGDTIQHMISLSFRALSTPTRLLTPWRYLETNWVSQLTLKSLYLWLCRLSSRAFWSMSKITF